MAGQKFTLTFDAQLNVNQMKGALANIQGELGKLQLPSNISQNFTRVINNLSKEISNFEVLTSKDLTDPKQFKQIEASADKILNLYKLIQVQIKDLGNTASIDIKKLFPESVIKSINKGKEAIAAYEKEVEKLDNKVKAANDNLKNWQDKLQVRTSKKNEKYNEALNDLTKDLVSDLARENGVKQQINDYNDLIIKIEQAGKALKEYDDAVASGSRKPNWLTEGGLFKNLERLKNTEKAYQEELKNNPNITAKAEKAVSAYSGKVTEAENKIAEFTATLKRLEDEAASGKANALDNLFKELEDKGFDTSSFKRSVEDAKKATEDFEKITCEGIRTATDQAREGIDNQSEAFEDNAHAAEDAADANKDFMNQMNEVDQIKSRITAFFGLSNAINLVRHAMRDAYETIKELDKAMTETAVVTDFSVGDMWAQLPEYTQRANELGVSTKAAYEAATLYYQQGLKTNEVMAMSNETLKMARIAGLDAAVATDRMTNAIRGFNMEINTTNAQRIDDVYSKLAAISASNVDEISTAMTKVASLAHSANMEFETTAAFLAQIIETTRESAETAGTALKTVVARFSEVKKLVDEGKLSGQDEEGEIIDVNKVSSALRTAGVDLNKYFLGQVGLDDIFMELASKWKKLTQLQQRYIATQAAGSRQQSRFIALMSDYARTQELVGEAYNANGAAAEQFNKTQESLESKLARLKNAWDEFTMGLLNSDLTKGIVDLLTNILNGVNQLTSGFGKLDEGVGGVINSVLKLSTLLMSLKLGKGIVQGLGKGLAGTAAAEGFKFLSVGAGLKTLGVGAAGGLKTLGAGLLKPLASLATSIVPLLPALAAIAAAGTTAYLVIKKLYDLSPAGQIKIAEKYVESLKEMTQAAKKEKQELESIQQEYGRLSEIVDNATNIQEKTEAIRARNDYIKSLLEENEIYAQYINDFEVKDGQIYLTIDEDALQNALDRVAEETKKREARENIGNANLLFQQYQQAVEHVAELERAKDAYEYFQTDEGKQKAENFKQNYNQAALGYDEEYAKDYTRYLTSLKWNPDIDNQYLAIAKDSMQRLQEQYFSYASQASLAILDTKKYSDEELTFLTKAIGQMYDGEAFQKAFNEILNSGKIGPFDLSNSDDIEKRYLKAFGDTTNIPKDENGKIDIKKAKEEIAAQEAINQLEESSKKLRIAFDDLIIKSPEVANNLLDLLNNAGENIKIKYWDLPESLSDETKSILEEIYELLPPEIQKQLKANADNLFPNAENAIMDPFSEVFDEKDLLDDFWDLIADLIRKFNLTTKQAGILSKTFADFATDNYDNLDKFNSSILALLDSITDDELKEQVFAAFDVLDTDSAASINNFFGVLETLGVDFSNLDLGFGKVIHSAEDAAKYLKELADVKDSFNIEELNAKVSDAISTIWGIRERKPTQQGYRTFSESEYKIIEDAVKALGPDVGINLDNFKRTGIKNKEWNYTGGDLEELVQLLVQDLNKAIQQAEDYISAPEWLQQNPDFATKEVVKIENQDFTLEEAFREIVANPETINKLPEDQLSLIKTAIESLGYEWQQALTSKGLVDVIKEALTEYDQFLANKETQSEINKATQSVDYLASVNQLNPEDRPGMTGERYTSAVEGKFAVDEHAEDRFEDILESLTLLETKSDHFKENMKEFGIDAETASKALAINWSETAAKLTELTEVLDKNDKILYESSKDSYEYSGAIHAVGEAMREAYGEQVSDEFVQAHIQQIVMARESKEAYQELLDLLQQDFFSNAKEGAVGLAGELWNVQQEMLKCIEAGYALDGIEYNGVAILDGTPWMTVVKMLLDAGADVEAFFNTLGWTVVYNKDAAGNPTSVQLVRNQPTGYGGYQPYTGNNWGRGSSGGGGSSPKEKEPTKEEWRSDFDWLYNLMEDITELQREQNKLQEEQNKILELGNDSDTGKDLYENLVKQMANLLTQKSYQQFAKDHRSQEMQEFMAANAGYGGYFRFNDLDQTLEINWDAINNIGNKETYEKVKDLVSQAESIQKKMDESDDALRDIETQIRQLEDIWREQYVDFEKRVLDALVKSYQRVIDNYSDLNDTITKGNEEILNAIQEEIALERQIRDNTKTEDEISDAEARLAFLRRDTTGGNQVEILNAQQQLDEMRQSYSDQLIDQSVSRLQDDNAKAAEQRERQIELMQAQLDYAVENGELNGEVRELIINALGADGELLTNSDLVSLLQQEESWAAMSATNKELWEDELNNTFKEVSAYLLKEQGEIDGTYLQDVAAAINDNVWASANVVGDQLEVGLDSMGQSIGLAIGSMSQAWNHVTYAYDDSMNGMREANQGLREANAGLANMRTENDALKLENSALRDALNQANMQKVGGGNPDSSAFWQRQHDLEMQRKRQLGFATGGLTTRTGPAWLDGTPAEPEYVLNARQTEAFLKLADVLPSMFNGVSMTTSNIGGTMYLNFDISVDSISNDYDVDQLVERVKDDIYNAASYRNANVISFSR